MYSTPCMLNASPSVLLPSQCFPRQYHAQEGGAEGEADHLRHRHGQMHRFLIDKQICG